MIVSEATAHPSENNSRSGPRAPTLCTCKAGRASVTTVIRVSQGDARRLLPGPGYRDWALSD